MGSSCSKHQGFLFFFAHTIFSSFQNGGGIDLETVVWKPLLPSSQHYDALSVRSLLCVSSANRCPLQ